MKVENIEALEEPPPFRQSLVLLLSFWLLPIWCFSWAIAGVLTLPASSSYYLCLCSFTCIAFFSAVLSVIRHSTIQAYSYTSYYWVTWVIVIVFAPELDNIYYTSYDWFAQFVTNESVVYSMAYIVAYYLIPAMSLLFLGQIRWEYYASYHDAVDWASILVDNTAFIVALLTWDSSLSDTGWLFISICVCLYYVIPRKCYKRLATKLSFSKHSASVARTTRKSFTVLSLRGCPPPKTD